MEKAPPTIKFYGVFNHFSQPHEVAKSWTIKLYHCISDIIHTNEQNMLIVATCKNMELFVYVILFYDEKRSFSTKVVTLASGPL